MSGINLWEAMGVASALGYVVLAGRNHWACWPVSLLSVVVYAGINFEAGLFAESALQLIYGVLSVVGWIRWKPAPNKPDAIVVWPANHFIWSGLLLIPASILLALLLQHYTPAQLPWLDAPITVFSLYATWLTTKRVLQQWIYWVAIDAISIWVYLNRSLPVTAFLYALYCLLACWGWWKWRQKLHQSS